MLEVGSPNLSPAETRSHFAFWAAMKGPLLIGTDLAKISDENVQLLKNRVLLAFNQDPIISKPAMPYKWGTNPDWTFNASFPAEFWSGDFFSPNPSSKSRGSPEVMIKRTLVLALNPASTTQTRDIVFAEVPELIAQGNGTRLAVADGWTGLKLGCFEDKYTAHVGGHDTALLVVDVCNEAPEEL
jgi:alpha-galactosidase